MFEPEVEPQEVFFSGSFSHPRSQGVMPEAECRSVDRQINNNSAG